MLRLMRIMQDTILLGKYRNKIQAVPIQLELYASHVSQVPADNKKNGTQTQMFIFHQVKTSWKHNIFEILLKIC